MLLDASPTQVGLLTAAVWGPNLVSLFVGSWVDQQPRKRVLLVVADLARAAVLATVPLAYALDALTLVHLYVVALLAGLGQVLFSTAYPPFFVALVPRDRFLDANSKLSASRSASFIAGPAVGGALVQALTAPVAILVDALTFVASAFQIGRVRVEEAPVENPHGHSLLRRAREGLVYVLRHPFLRYSLGCATTINFFTLMASALLVLFASRTLGLSAGLIGLALGIGALGGLVGAVAAPVLAARFGVGPVIVAGAILFPAPLALLALAGGPDWSAALVLGAVEFVSALGVMLFDVNLNALQASVTPGCGPQPRQRRLQHDQLRDPPARRRRRRRPRDADRPPADARRRRRSAGRSRRSGCCRRRSRACTRSTASSRPRTPSASRRRPPIPSEAVADRNSTLEPVTAPEPETLPSEHDRSRASLLGKLLAPLVLVGGIVLKFGAFTLKFFGIFLAVGGYTLIWGWRFAVGVVLLILAHELGHYIEARRAGLDPQLPVFVPFLGAYVALRNMRFDPWVNARVSLAGPVYGGIAALGCLAAAVTLDSDLLRALAYAGFLLNLINLAPIAFLDGGHVMRSWRVLRAGGGRRHAGAVPAARRRRRDGVARDRRRARHRDARRARAARPPVSEGSSNDRELLRRSHPTLGNDVSLIASEFLAGFQLVQQIDRPAVSIFGSARVAEATPTYEAARTTARLFAGAGLAVVTGGGPGVMEAANRGAQEGGGLSIGFNIVLPHEQSSTRTATSG